MVGNRVDTVVWPMDTALVAIVRGGRVITPTPDDTSKVNDELLFVSAEDQEKRWRICSLTDGREAGRRPSEVLQTPRP